MLTSVTGIRRNAYDKSIDASLRFGMDVSSPYIVKGINGLGPVPSQGSTLETPLDRGALDLGGRTGTRNIVFNIGFKNGRSDIAELRDELYDLYMPGNMVELYFETSNLGTLTTLGRVETTEPVIFEREPTVQVSIICADPYFARVNETETLYYPPAVELPTFAVPFEGKVPVGFKFELKVEQPVSRIALIGHTGDDRDRFVVNFAAEVGDVFRISTLKGIRYAIYRRNNVEQSVLGYFDGTLVGFNLKPGKNWFTLEDSGKFSGLKFTSVLRWGGI